MRLGFSNSSGRRLWLDALYVTGTYAGVLEGTPSIQSNNSLIRGSATAMERLWGARATYVVPPERRIVEDGGVRFETLPSTVFYAWLTSTPVNPEWCGSELVVVWFDEEPTRDPLPSLLMKVMANLQWELLAKDFDY